MAGDERIAVLARRPEPGRVKTRLAARLGAEAAARLHLAFVEDVVARFRQAGRPLRLWHDGELAGARFEALGVPLAPQGEGDLGQRIARALAGEVAAGAERVVVLGADSPDLPHGRVEAAFAALAAGRDLVLVPAFDGGYALVGARGVPHAALAGIPWGSDRVLEATLAAAAAAELTVALLEPWYDVDRPEDLAFLRRHLFALLATAGEDRCPATRRALGIAG